MKLTWVLSSRTFHAETTVCVVVLALFLSSVQARAEETNRANITWSQVVGSLHTSDAKKLVVVVSNWPRAPLYQRLSILDALVEKLSQRDTYPISENVKGAERYDMTIVAGRAAWLMELIMQVQLPAIPRGISEADLAKVQSAGRQLAAEYRLKELDRARLLRQEPSVEKLQAAYVGRITQGIRTNAINAWFQMSALLNEWFPLEKDMKDFERIIGTKAAPRDGGMVYDFDNGYVGGQFFFKVDGGKIKGVFIGTPD